MLWILLIRKINFPSLYEGFRKCPDMYVIITIGLSAILVYSFVSDDYRTTGKMCCLFHAIEQKFNVLSLT